MRSWFFAKDGQQHGPVTEDDLSDMLAAGALSTDALVWTQEMKEWRPAKEVLGIYKPALKIGDQDGERT